MTYKVCSIKFRIKLSTVLLLCLLRNLMEQTLGIFYILILEQWIFDLMNSSMFTKNENLNCQIGLITYLVKNQSRVAGETKESNYNKPVLIGRVFKSRLCPNSLFIIIQWDWIGRC